MMGESKNPFSMRIFIPSGDPGGLKVVEKTNWTGVGVVFPRPLLSEVRKRSELDRAGVYILWGPGGSPDIPRAYVGEGDPVLPRLEEHARKKDFWTNGAIFTSKDRNINKAHVQHLEARLISLASKAKRCEMDNANSPQLPNLSEADYADVEAFLKDMLLCLPLFGINFFEPPSGECPGVPELYLRRKNIEARGVETPQGFVVSAGSTIAGKAVPSTHSRTVALREELIKMGVLEPTDGGYKFTQDYPFSSPSAASDVVLGRSSNGLVEWKDATGTTLKELREKPEGAGS
ncbi:MAG: GIY-YIG nuclease family protein [Thermaerobacter sp.]|jgi:hypothetical protein|nr:GIY-YIG nuclease family protein [Thermaerobacter sp.]